MTDIQIEEFVSNLKINGGYTFWLDGNERTSGYCVGNNNYSVQVPSKLDYVNLLYVVYDFLAYSRILQLRGEQVDAIGGWLDKDTNTIYLDIVRHIDNLGDALELAKCNQELAIYDLSTQSCIDV